MTYFLLIISLMFAQSINIEIMNTNRTENVDFYQVYQDQEGNLTVTLFKNGLVAFENDTTFYIETIGIFRSTGQTIYIPHTQLTTDIRKLNISALEVNKEISLETTFYLLDLNTGPQTGYISMLFNQLIESLFLIEKQTYLPDKSSHISDIENIYQQKKDELLQTTDSNQILEIIRYFENYSGTKESLVITINENYKYISFLNENYSEEKLSRDQELENLINDKKNSLIENKSYSQSNILYENAISTIDNLINTKVNHIKNNIAVKLRQHANEIGLKDQTVITDALNEINQLNYLDTNYLNTLSSNAQNRQNIQRLLELKDVGKKSINDYIEINLTLQNSQLNIEITSALNLIEKETDLSKIIKTNQIALSNLVNYVNQEVASKRQSVINDIRPLVNFFDETINRIISEENNMLTSLNFLEDNITKKIKEAVVTRLNKYYIEHKSKIKSEILASISPFESFYLIYIDSDLTLIEFENHMDETFIDALKKNVIDKYQSDYIILIKDYIIDYLHNTSYESDFLYYEKNNYQTTILNRLETITRFVDLRIIQTEVIRFTENLKQRNVSFSNLENLYKNLINSKVYSEINKELLIDIYQKGLITLYNVTHDNLEETLLNIETALNNVNILSLSTHQKRLYETVPNNLNVITIENITGINSNYKINVDQIGTEGIFFEGFKILKAFDITLMDAHVKVVAYEGEYLIGIRLNINFDTMKDIKVIHKTPEGYQTYNLHHENGWISFYTESFSEFYIVYTEKPLVLYGWITLIFTLGLLFEVAYLMHIKTKEKYLYSITSIILFIPILEQMLIPILITIITIGITIYLIFNEIPKSSNELYKLKQKTVTKSYQIDIKPQEQITHLEESLSINESPIVLQNEASNSVEATNDDAKEDAIYDYSFLARFIQAPIDSQKRFSELKNYILSYEGVTTVKSYKFERFMHKNRTVLKVWIHGQNMKLYFNLNIEGIDKDIYLIEDLSNIKKHMTTPSLFLVKNQKNLIQALELIDLYFKDKGQKQFRVNKDYTKKYLDKKTLIQRDLIRVKYTKLK